MEDNIRNQILEFVENQRKAQKELVSGLVQDGAMEDDGEVHQGDVWIHERKPLRVTMVKDGMARGENMFIWLSPLEASMDVPVEELTGKAILIHREQGYIKEPVFNNVAEKFVDLLARMLYENGYVNEIIRSDSVVRLVGEKKDAKVKITVEIFLKEMKPKIVIEGGFFIQELLTKELNEGNVKNYAEYVKRTVEAI